jgi:hypothetical protein
VSSAEKVVTPLLQGMDDGEQFMVIDIVVLFCGTQCLQEISTGVQVSIGVLLRQHSPSCGE